MKLRIDTSLPLARAVEIFREAMEEQSGLKRMAGQSTVFESAPTDSVFGSLEQNAPDFQVIARLSGSAMDRNASVHLLAWDKGTSRVLEINSSTSAMSRGAKARKFLDRCVDQLKAADPGSTVQR